MKLVESEIIYNLTWYAWITGPDEWLSFWRSTSNLSWSWKKFQFLHYKYFSFLIYNRIIDNVFIYLFINTSL